VKLNMKNLVLILVIVMMASFLLAGLLGATIAPFWGGSAFNANVEPFDQTHEFELGDIRIIEANTISTDINIIPLEEGATIKVHLYGKVTPDTIAQDFARVNGGRLTVNARPRVGINTNTRIDLTLDIYVPQGYVATIQGETVSGDMNVPALDISKLSFKTVSGELEASGLALDTADFTSVSGNIRARLFTANSAVFRTTYGDIDITGFSGDINARTVSGDLLVEYAAFDNDVTFNTTSGRARLFLPADSYFSVLLETVSGQVNSDFPLSIISTSRNRFEGTNGESGNRIEVKSVSGDVTLNRR
jgi:lia operon protein LiaG